MEYPEHGIASLRHEGERESWSFALCGAMPVLRGLVAGYCLYEERRLSLPTHRHLPHPGVTFIIGLDGNMEVRDPSGEYCRVAAGQGFLAGLHSAPARTRSEHNQRGMEIALSPLGAHLLLQGLPMDELSNRAVSMWDLLAVLGRAGARRRLPRSGAFLTRSSGAIGAAPERAGHAAAARIGRHGRLAGQRTFRQDRC